MLIVILPQMYFTFGLYPACAKRLLRGFQTQETEDGPGEYV